VYWFELLQDKSCRKIRRNSNFKRSSVAKKEIQAVASSQLSKLLFLRSQQDIALNEEVSQLSKLQSFSLLGKRREKC
jgi:hypothetical protein